MLKKTFAFGLLAAALTIAPSAAFAGQYQENIQVTEQNGAAINGSTNAQTSTSVNVQEQIQKAQQAAGRYSRYKKPYYGGSKTCAAPQSQASRQVTNQSGAATDDSVNAQNSNTRNNQRQTLANNCR